MTPEDVLLAGAVGLAVELAGRASGPTRSRVRSRVDHRSSPIPGGLRLRTRRRSRTDPTAALAAAVTAVAAELRAGRSPGEAWRAALGVPVGSHGVPDVVDVVAAVGGRLPPDVRPAVGRRPGSVGWPAVGRRPASGEQPDAFGSRPAVGRRPARRRTADAARLDQQVCAVLAATRLAASIGAPLGAVLESSGRTLAADADAETAVRAALAGPRQTVALLTWLPAAGVGLGALFGADPLGVLLGGGLGSTAGFAGAGLTLAGRWWVARLVAAARGAGADASRAPGADRAARSGGPSG